MAVAVGDIWLITAYGSAFNQTILNTFHYRQRALAPGNTETTIEDIILNNISAGGGGAGLLENALLPCVPPQYTLHAWWVQKVNPVRVRKREQSRNVAGQFADNARNVNTAISITKQTALSGRRQQGRVQLGPVGILATTQDQGVLQANMVAPLTAFANVLNDPLSGDLGITILDPILYHKGQVPNFDVVTTAFFQNTVRVMRRRTVGVGK